MAYRVLLSDSLGPEGLARLREQPDLEIDARPGLSPAELEEGIGGYHALIVRSATKVTADVIARADQLRVIGRAGIGVDNIDVDAATKRGIVVMNTPGGSNVTTAEHAIALLLALARNIPQAAAAVRAGAQAIGWTLFSKSPANSVTALEPPAGVDAGAVVKRLRDTHGITVAGGQDHTKGKMIRIGHMGAYDLSDMYVVLGALEECTGALGRKATGAIEAARRAWETA